MQRYQKDAECWSNGTKQLIKVSPGASLPFVCPIFFLSLLTYLVAHKKICKNSPSIKSITRYPSGLKATNWTRRGLGHIIQVVIQNIQTRQEWQVNQCNIIVYINFFFKKIILQTVTFCRLLSTLANGIIQPTISEQARLQCSSSSA